MKLSIIITSWNTERLLRACLTSIQQFPPQCSFETIVVDNASKDGSSAMVRSEFPSVILIDHPNNSGYAGGNNIGYAKSSGEYILLLGSDTEVTENAVQRMLDHLDSRKDAGMVSCRLEYPNGDIQRSCKRFPTVLNAVAMYCSLHFLNTNYLMNEFDHLSVLEIDQPDATCVMIRREALGPFIFDEQYSILYNDVDLCQRVKRKGWKIVFIPDAVVIHHGSQSTKQAPQNVRLVMYQNILRYYRSYFGMYAQFILAPILFIRYTAATRSMNGFSLFYSMTKGSLS
ncbi:MAG: glycosyltransferase family 2 protein [Bacteroidota bacterium]